jgi:hypothetical protein
MKFSNLNMYISSFREKPRAPIKRLEPDHDHELEDLDKDSEEKEGDREDSGIEMTSSPHPLHHKLMSVKTTTPSEHSSHPSWRAHLKQFVHHLLDHPDKLHQDILRSLNLHSILHQGLCMDYK